MTRRDLARRASERRTRTGRVLRPRRRRDAPFLQAHSSAYRFSAASTSGSDMTIVFIENAHGSGQIIHVLEDFGGYVVKHKLEPGDNRRIAMSQFKSIIVSEAIAGGDALAF